ncbi:MAG: hypothetical protein AAF591_06355 [Verrucomicrobiota bacterium]
MDPNDGELRDGKSHPDLKGDPGTFRPARVAGRSQERGQADLFPWFTRFMARPWVKILSVALVIGIGIWVWSLAWRSAESESAVAARERGAEVAEGEVAEVVEPDVLPADAVQGFLEAETVEERLAWTRRAERVSGLMNGESVSSDAVALPIDVQGVNFMGRVLADKKAYFNFHVVLGDGGSRLLAVVPTEAGPRVDWEVFARYQPMGWERILGEGTGEEGVPVRVFVSASDYYNYGYGDEEEWSCYELNSPDLEERMFVYAERDAEFDSELREFLGAHNGNREERAPVHRQRMIVRIRVDSEEAKRGQARLLDVVQYGWVEDGDDIEAAVDWTVPEVSGEER